MDVKEEVASEEQENRPAHAQLHRCVLKVQPEDFLNSTFFMKFQQM